MEFLPAEIILEIASHLQGKDALNLALTGKTIYAIVIEQLFSCVCISGTTVKDREVSKRCLISLLAEDDKMVGVRELVVGEVVGNRDGESSSTVNDTSNGEFSHLVDEMLTCGWKFPRLHTVHYHSSVLSTRHQMEHFLTFLGRHRDIHNVLVDQIKFGDSFELPRKFTPLHLANLRRVEIYGPVLPLLLGFSLQAHATSDQLGHHFGPLIRACTERETVPLELVHIWWPSQEVFVSLDSDGESSVVLKITDVLKALSSVCGSTLQVLTINSADKDVDENVVEIASSGFPKLQEFEIRPGSLSDEQAHRVHHDYVKMGRIARSLKKLRKLEIFMYRSNREGQNMDREDENWQEPLEQFAGHESLNFLQLHNHTWDRGYKSKHIRV
ncbi:hypothetical protein AMATHDRAFT_55216 [Amanita thiersii Skay4041]|uniref:F-box domain-containing protein n=1 Tax=Amanita thiersii Skay4041 TaxID=703135 RepID=A0A2A9NQU6_9AGAR|nr:hypothetical protein AMATHDRAFT_55216 [Amanita thiersii Skay4041]